jgi:predicted proteasome-type protease
VAAPGGRSRCAKCSGGTAAHLAQDNIDANASLILGGRSTGEEQRTVQHLSAGQFHRGEQRYIYFQLGESKYGKPILDRVITIASTPMQVAKCVLVSFDSTIRSNISVGLPIDCCGIRATASRSACSARRRRQSVLQHAAPGLGLGSAQGVRRAGIRTWTL